MSTTVVVGNPRPGSRTLQAAQLALVKLTGREADTVLDLVGLGAGLLDWKDAGVAAAVEAVTASELVVVASPTYKGAYTGLLKLFLDRFGAGALVGTTGVPLMLGGDWRHSLAPEVFLKPVLTEIGLACPTRGLFLLDAEFERDDAWEGWLAGARRQLPAHLLG